MTPVDMPVAVQQAIAAAIMAPTDDWREDDGYAENDHTSRWIERVGEKEFV